MTATCDNNTTPATFSLWNTRYT